MAENKGDFEIYLSNGKNKPEGGGATAVRKFTVRLAPGKTRYEIPHGLSSEDVVVQTRIAGNIREGGVSILNKDTVCVTFGGTLNEPMDVVVIG